MVRFHPFAAPWTLTVLAATTVTAEPRIETSGGNVVINTADDFRVAFTASPAAEPISVRDMATQISTLASQVSTLSDQLAATTARLDRMTGGSGCPAGRTLGEFLPDGTPICIDSIGQPIIDDINSRIASNRAEPCLLTVWSEWSECSAECEGTQTRTREIRQNATNSVPCTAFALQESQQCGPVCPEEADPCNGNEKWYNLNSGSTWLDVASYTEQNIIIRRDANVAANVAAHGVGALFPMAQGATSRLTSVAALKSAQFWAGDWICGTNGSIEVQGRTQIENAPQKQREWIPARLAGRTFVVPVVRNGGQFVMLRAMEEAVVQHFDANRLVQSWQLKAGEIGSFSFTRTNRFLRIEASGDIIASIASGSGSASLAPVQTGSADYMPLVPAAAELFGVPSNSAGFGAYSATINYTTQRFTLSCGNSRANRTLALNPAGDRIARIPGTGGHSEGAACRVTTATGNVPMGIASVGDGDGGEGTMWLPRALFKRNFLVPFNLQHAAIVCLDTAQITIQRRRGITAGQVRVNAVKSAAAGPNGIAKAYVRSAIAIGPGSFWSSTQPCMVVADSALEGQELTIFGSD